MICTTQPPQHARIIPCLPSVEANDRFSSRRHHGLQRSKTSVARHEVRGWSFLLPKSADPFGLPRAREARFGFHSRCHATSGSSADKSTIIGVGDRSRMGRATGTWSDFAEPSYLRDVFGCEDNFTFAPAGVRELTRRCSIAKPSLGTAHQRCSFCRFEEFEFHVSPIQDECLQHSMQPQADSYMTRNQ
ncbi:hypothetical protein SAMN04487912_105105 [Arthrobacter sp. cf158]|nr:hypothetical protein SAMN04487912_105105 [Arthrobacter sp. cf158]